MRRPIVDINTVECIKESTDWPEGSSDGMGKVTEDIPASIQLGMRPPLMQHIRNYQSQGK